MTQSLKIECLVTDLTLEGEVASFLVTKEQLTAGLSKKADLVDGKIKESNLPDFIANGFQTVNQKLSTLETSITDGIQSAKDYAEAYTDEKLIQKADLVDGKVPQIQLPSIEQYEGLNEALNGVLDQARRDMIERTDEIQRTKADLGEDGKVVREQLPNYDKIPGLETVVTDLYDSKANVDDVETSFKESQDQLDAHSLLLQSLGSILPYNPSNTYEEGYVTLKDGILQQLVSGDWVPFKINALNLVDLSGESQQQVNYNGGSKWHYRDGGYQENDRAVLDNGDIVKSVVDGNKTDPNVDMAGWELLPSRSEIEELNKATDFYVTPQMFAPKGINIGDGVVDAYPYIQAALDTKFPVKLPFPSVKYRVTQNIVFNGHSFEGMAAAPELYGSAEKAKVIIEFDGVTGDAVTNQSTLSNIKNVWFRQKDWSTGLNGLFFERYAYFDSCLFTHFNGFGFYSWTNGIAETSLAAYHSVFNKCQFLYNKKHGVALFNGANAIALYDCLSRWNGSPIYGVKPTVAGLYDGLYVDGKNSDYPPSYALEPQGCLVVGGDYSYNSRYGQNWHSCGQNVLQGGYIEGNLVHDLRLGSIFGMQVNNPYLKMVTPVLNVIEQDPNDATRNLNNYPNNIVVNGTDYGVGLIHATASTQRGANAIRHMPVFRTKTSVTNMFIFSKTNGEFWFECATRGNSVNFSDTVPLKANNLRIGSYARSSISDSEAIRAWFSSNTGAEGEAIATFVGQNAPFATIRTAKGSGANPADCFFSMTKNSITNRTINAAGTINASGADYAEYMHKADGCGDIQKGEIVGVNSEGKLTKQYDESISFVVKSTDPSIVGGDTWFSGEFRETEPQYSFDKELAEDATQNEIDEFNRLKSEYIDQLKSEIASYKQRKADFDEQMELARQKVDRIAFCGQVPIIYSSSVGDYIIPSRNRDGTIGVETTKTPTFEQHLKSVGKVWRVVEGISHIVVFNN